MSLVLQGELYLCLLLLMFSLINPHALEGPHRYIGRFLDSIPDRCQMPGCTHKGWFGYENVMDNGVVICDYCSVRYYLITQGLIKDEGDITCLEPRYPNGVRSLIYEWLLKSVLLVVPRINQIDLPVGRTQTAKS